MNRCCLNMWEMMFHLLCEVLGVAYPVARLARAGCFIVAQVLMQRLNKLDALTQ